jgi:tetratricopeptide (TPR) repeat protein
MGRLGVLGLLLAVSLPIGGGGRALSETPRASAHVVISTRPGAVVFVNEVRRGVTDARGRLTVMLEPGTYRLRVSKLGYEEAHVRLRLTPGARRQLVLTLPPLRDPAERHRQRAEALREQRLFAQAAAAYRRAIALRKGRFPRARLGLARALLALEEPEEALRQVRRALAESRAPLPEAHTLLGNILRAQGLYEEAIREYRVALRQTGDVSPEAHAGLALALGEIGETERAIAHMRTAIAQNADAEPILYYLLGNLLLDAERPQDAIAAYETYLRLAPQSETAPAVRSLVDQLRKESGSQELR